MTIGKPTNGHGPIWSAVRQHSYRLCRMRACVFCGGIPLTREHVYPQWLRQFSAPQAYIQREGSYQDPFPQTVVRQDEQGKYVVVDEARGNKTPVLHEVTVKSVCASCNNGWMSRLEGAVQGPLKRMADPPKPPPHIVSNQTQTLLATWAHKCFMMYDQYRDARDRVFVDEDFVNFKKFQKPPRSARIYMGITNSPISTFAMWHETHLLSLDFETDPQVTLATTTRNLSSSHLGVQGVYFIEQYFKPSIPWTANARWGVDLAAMAAVSATPARLIWPPNKKLFRWPPPLTSESEFDQARTALLRIMNSLPSLAKRPDGSP